MATRTMTQEVGNRYGRLLVLAEGGKRSVRCRCDCGSEKEVRIYHLRRGRTQSCGCLGRELRRAAALQEVGNRYGRLVVVGEAGSRGSYRYVRCRCDCGVEKEIRAQRLRSGETQSCGCLQRERVRAASIRHGLSDTPIHRLWRGMNQRCSNPRHMSYPRYGGRGITVCPEWSASYEAFLAAVGPRPSPQHSLERVDNSAGYSPENCVWATAKDQMRNYRRNHLITYRGRAMCVAAWAEEVGINYMTLWSRLAKGWPIHQALTRRPQLRAQLPA